MKSLEKYKVLLWDFDGVILDSMPVRELGFRRVLASFPSNQVDELIGFHRKNGGWSRYVKFRYFFEVIRQEKVSSDQIGQLSDQFSTIMRGLLIDENLLIRDSLDYIQEQGMKRTQHIVSGSDGNELRFLCEQLGITKYFVSIEGSPTPKEQLIRQLLGNYGYLPSEVVMIGDAVNDYDAAQANDIDFAGYNNEALLNFGALYIHSFCKPEILL